MASTFLKTGTFTFKVTSKIPSVISEISKLYSKQVVSELEFYDFDIELTRPNNIRRYIRPQVNFSVNEHSPFKPLPLNHAYPMLEWGMNWCIANYAHHYLVVHAAAIEKNNKVIVMPAHSGAGKSTLTASLVFNGWRLFSDELSLFNLDDRLVYPLSRPINLKNQSIDIIKRHVTDSVFSDVVKDTHKGTVSLLQAPTDSVNRDSQPAPLVSFVFPKFVKDADTVLVRCGALTAYEKIIEQSFNYHILGHEAYELLTTYLNQVDCYVLEYSDFSEANMALTELIEE